MSHFLYLFTSKIQNPKDVDLIASLGLLISNCIIVESETRQKMLLLIEKHELILQCLCDIINRCSILTSSDGISSSVLSIISSSANIIAVVAACPKLKTKVLLKHLSNKNKDLVKHLISCITISSGESLAIERSLMRESILKALHVLSAVDEIRPYFSPQERNNKESASIIVRTLLAIASSFKSELEITRETSLIVLTNISTPIKSDDTKICYHISQDIVDHGGIEILMNLCCTGEIKRLAIKHRSSGLLSRLVLSSSSSSSSSSVVSLISKEAANKIWNEFIRVTSSPEFLTSTQSSSSQSRHDTAAISSISNNLLRISIQSVHNIEWSSRGIGNAHTIISLLPKPRTNSRGLVDSSSVCLPPQQLTRRIAAETASAQNIINNDNSARTSTSFHTNLLKLLIDYLDVLPDHHYQYVVDAHGIECLICLLANSNHSGSSTSKSNNNTSSSGSSNNISNSHEHGDNTSMMKNAASVLARLVKFSDFAMKRCRELRGMEILMDLGKAGRI